VEVPLEAFTVAGRPSEARSPGAGIVKWNAGGAACGIPLETFANIPVRCWWHFGKWNVQFLNIADRLTGEAPVGPVGSQSVGHVIWLKF